MMLVRKSGRLGFALLEAADELPRLSWYARRRIARQIDGFAPPGAAFLRARAAKTYQGQLLRCGTQPEHRVMTPSSRVCTREGTAISVCAPQRNPLQPS